jgi:hypothetical protein
MIDIVSLASFIEGKLNANSEGLVFRTFTLEKTLDTRYTMVDQQKVSFIPSIISNPVGSYLPMNDIQGSRVSFNLEIMLPLKLKLDWLAMLNAFIYTINGKVFYLQNGTFSETKFVSGAYTTIKMTAQTANFGLISPTNLEQIDQIASYLPISRTEEYILINVPFNLKTINGFIVGDEVKISVAEYVTASWETATSSDITTFGSTLTISDNPEITSQSTFIQWLNNNHYLSETYATAFYTGVSPALLAKNPSHPKLHNYYKLKILDFSVKNTKLPITQHPVGEDTGKTYIKENDVKYILTAYYEKTSVLDNILGNIVLGTNQNKYYWLKMELPSGLYYRKSVLFDNNAVFPIDDFAIIPLVFTKAF